jgi:hypothetical protein
MKNKVLFVLVLSAVSLVLEGCVVKVGPPGLRRLSDSPSPQFERQNAVISPRPETAPASAERT